MELVVADVSFISLTLLLGPLTAVTAPDGALLLLVKPQFEVGRERLGPAGVVREDDLRRSAVAAVTAAAEDLDELRAEVADLRAEVRAAGSSTRSAPARKAAMKKAAQSAAAG